MTLAEGRHQKAVAGARRRTATTDSSAAPCEMEVVVYAKVPVNKIPRAHDPWDIRYMGVSRTPNMFLPVGVIKMPR